MICHLQMSSIIESVKSMKEEPGNKLAVLKALHNLIADCMT